MFVDEQLSKVVFLGSDVVDDDGCDWGVILLLPGVIDFLYEADPFQRMIWQKLLVDPTKLHAISYSHLLSGPHGMFEKRLAVFYSNYCSFGGDVVAEKTSLSPSSVGCHLDTRL